MKITPGSCPYCGVINRESEAVKGMTTAPEVGTIMICEDCANPSIYVGHGAARKPTEYEMSEILDDADAVAAIFEAQMGMWE